jgi:hypothetical protein
MGHGKRRFSEERMETTHCQVKEVHHAQKKKFPGHSLCGGPFPLYATSHVEKRR